MRRIDPLALVPQPRRYPFVIAACWIAGCGVLAWAAGEMPRAEPFYLPAILAVAWYYGLPAGLTLALTATAVASVAEMANGAVFGTGVLAWNFLARGMLFALPTWLLHLVREQQRRIAAMALTDPLTGLFTRHGMLGTIGEELVRTERFGGDTSIVCVGLNGLLPLAVQHGAEHAEAIVDGFGNALGASARRTDVVARLAEDEFALLLRGTGDEAAAAVADKLGRSLTDWLLTQGHDLTCSVGVTTAPRGRRFDAPALLARAIAHMYENRSARPTGKQPDVPSRPAAVVPQSVRHTA